MKRILSNAFSLLIVVTSFSQQPIHWSFFSKKIDEKSFELHILATIDDSWHTYSQSTPEGGPTPTQIKFVKNPLISLKGKVNEVGDLHQIHDEAFGVDVRYFDTKIDFVQIVELKSAVKAKQAGTIQFMVCNDHECLPPKTIEFSIALN